MSAAPRYLLAMAVTAVVSAGLVGFITPVFHLIEFSSPWGIAAEVAGFTLLAAPLLVTFRKSSSLFLYALVLLPLYALDLYLEDHFRAHGLRAVWMYTPGTFISRIEPPALRFLFTLSVDALLIGPVCLWISRLLASAFRPKVPANARQEVPPGQSLFPESWIEGAVPRPARDAGFWILRLLGLAYLGYLALLLLGGLGAAAWPPSVGMLFEMTYANAYLATNTVAKIGLMTGLAFTGAYNPRLRQTATLALLLGHAVSVVASLVFYAVDPPGTPYRDFLLTSSLVDGGMILLFLWILWRTRKDSAQGESETLLSSFSLPLTLWRYVLLGLAAYSSAVIVVSLIGRFGQLPLRGWDALFSFPDPTLGNSLTLYSTLAFLCLSMARQQYLRDALTGLLCFSLGLAILLGVLLLAVGSATVALPGEERPLSITRYLMLHVLEFVGVVAALSTLRSLYYNVEYTITSFRAPSAQAILGIHDALFPPRERSDVVQAVDRYAANIRGRRRGLLNFPFWLLEVLLPPVFGLHPGFSIMSPEEQRYFLRKYLIRHEHERQRSFVPELAGLAYQLAVAAHSVVLFAVYASRARQGRIGYVPPGGRLRLQGDSPSSAPPSQGMALLPTDERDLANFRPSAPARRVPAPRVITPGEDKPLPEEVDYLVVGSGPGGAVAAYRLAREEKTATIAVLERGDRYAPLQDFSEYELDMVAKLYKEGGIQQTKRADMIVLQGECVGGGSVINNAVCYRMPDHIHELWQREYGLDLGSLPAEYDRIAGELGIGPLPADGINQVVRAVFEQAVESFNATPGVSKLEPVRVVDVNAPAAVGDGLWNLGNKYLGKRSMLETFIPWSEARGVAFLPKCTAISFTRSGQRAGSVLVRTVGGMLHRIRIRKALVVAGGVIASSHFLMRSGVERPVGQRMSCNFALPATLELDRVVDAFDGEQITLGTKDSQNRALFETYFNPPGAFALTLPFYFDRHRAVMERYRHLVNFGALVGSESNGVLERQPSLINGQSFTWKLGPKDEEHIRYALGMLLELGRGAGARRIALPTRPGVEFEPTEENIREFNRRLSTYRLRMQDLLVNTAHPQGGNLMAGRQSLHRDERVVDEDFRVVGLDNVYVVDASVFPTSITVNPQWTIMAMSSLAASRILQAHA
ncbi:GMC family oxidoreductase N-terminal domain-containing protein [Archangium lipolyticum]|uniref:GMC family oxidoreductase N-terminal domain-containing protein n=1 Tax=Archangium lipolyticum TaxID=2970465 RepID=UPI002149AECA|nr:GMC family oxidoreductase N-terminal domain-containing protein [Archangium lipolyticum]